MDIRIIGNYLNIIIHIVMIIITGFILMGGIFLLRLTLMFITN